MGYLRIFAATGLVWASLGEAHADPSPITAHSLRGDMLAPPVGVPTPPAGHRPRVKQGTIFVNFDGENILAGGWSSDDSRTNTSFIAGDYPSLAGAYPPFGNGAKRDATLQATAADWKDFDVIVTDTRPAGGDYTMAMVGPASIGGPLGIAPVDCDDAMTHNNIVYAFHEVNDWASAAGVAVTIGQEVAHSYGLEHVNDPSDIMNPSNSGMDASFSDRCTSITGQHSCPAQHQRHCPGGQQNGYQELLTLFGPGIPDMAPPTVEITYPSDGANFEPGASFEITASASDDVGVTEARLFVNGELMGSDGADPFSWGVSDIPAGDYELYVIAVDAAQNETMSGVVDITVGDAGQGGDDGDGPGGDDGGGDDGAGDDGDNLPPGLGDGGERDLGCGCTSTDGRQLPVTLAWIVVFGVPRRRAAKNR